MIDGLLKMLSSYPMGDAGVSEAEGGGPAEVGADWPPGEKNGRLVPTTERELLGGGEPKPLLLPNGEPIGGLPLLAWGVDDGACDGVD